MNSDDNTCDSTDDNTYDEIYEAIEKRFHSMYPIKDPLNWMAVIKHCFGGPSPLDYVQAYECKDEGTHLHYCTYGFALTLGFDFELTLRLAPVPEDAKKYCLFLQKLGQYCVDTWRSFKE